MHSHTHARYHELLNKRQLSHVKKYHVKRSRYSKPFPEKKILSKKKFPSRQDNQNYKLRMDTSSFSLLKESSFLLSHLQTTRKKSNGMVRSFLWPQF